MTNLLLDLVFFIVLRHTEEHNLQLPKVYLHGLEQPYGYPSPKQVAAGKMPGAEMYINKADVVLALVLHSQNGIVEE